MTPIMVLVFGIHPATAVGTDLLHAAITKAGGTHVHARKGSVDWRITGLLATGSLPAAVITLTALHSLIAGRGGSKIITITLGVALLLTAAALAVRGRLRSFEESKEPVLPRHPVYTILTGVFLGVIVSLSSVGAGALGIQRTVFSVSAHGGSPHHCV